MADETSAADVLRDRAPAPPAPQPSSLYDLSASLMGQSTGIAERRAKRFETGASEAEAEATRITELARTQEAARTAARPTTPDLTKPPSTAARAFLEPGPSVLGQLQTAMLGIGQIALGMAGAKGPGYAIAATAALKGAAEGWQQGDADRVRRSLEEWATARQHLMDGYQIERDQFNDLLTNQKLSMSERFAQLRMRAEIMGMKDLADQARQENLAGVLDFFQKADKSNLEHEKAAAQIEHWRGVQANVDRAYQATEENRRKLDEARREAGGRSERGLQLREETSKAVLTLQGQETALAQKLQNAGVVREAVDLLDKEGILPKGATVWDTAKSKLALQSKPGRGDIAQAVQVIQRLGTALVIGTEVGLGTTGSALRLKVVGEAEAGNLIGAPKTFWDLFLPLAEKKWTADRAIARQHLERLGRLPPAASEPEILWRED